MLVNRLIHFIAKCYWYFWWNPRFLNQQQCHCIFQGLGSKDITKIIRVTTVV